MSVIVTDKGHMSKPQTQATQAKEEPKRRGKEGRSDDDRNLRSAK